MSCLRSGRVEGLRTYQLPFLGLTIAILNLKVWQPGEVAWFAVEIDYNSEAPTARLAVEENTAIARYGSPESSR
jgi:hypothetical protein